MVLIFKLFGLFLRTVPNKFFSQIITLISLPYIPVSNKLRYIPSTVQFLTFCY